MYYMLIQLCKNVLKFSVIFNSDLSSIVSKTARSSTILELFAFFFSFILWLSVYIT